MSAHTQGLLVRDHRGHPHADVRAASGRAVAVTWGVCASAPKTAAGCEARTDEDRALLRRREFDQVPHRRTQPSLAKGRVSRPNGVT